MRIFWRLWFTLPRHRSCGEFSSRLNLIRHCGQSLSFCVNVFLYAHIGINLARYRGAFSNLIFLPTHCTVYNCRLLDRSR